MDGRAAQDLLIEVIVQGVQDYAVLKAAGLIRFGRPNVAAIVKCEKVPRNMTHDEVEGVCEFIWNGWMEKMIEIAQLKVSATPIYKKLEPHQWRTLTSTHQTESATLR